MRRIIATLLLLSMVASVLPPIAIGQEATPEPLAPLLLEPANEAVASPLPTFAWSVSDADSVARIEIATDAAFSDVRIAEIVEETTFKPESPFAPGSTWYWRVWSIPAAGEATVSAIWSFTIEPQPTETLEPTPFLEPTQPESTASAVPTSVSSTPEPTDTPASQPTAVATVTPHLKTEPTPAARSAISGNHVTTGYRLAGVGRSANSVHPNVLADGNLGTIWTSAANHPESAYLVLALDSAKPIGEIRWVLGQTGRADHIRIAVSTDRSAWTEVGRARNSPVGEWQRILVDRTARFIRFQFVNVRGDRWLGGLVEVEALPPVAKPKPTATPSPSAPTPIADGLVRNASFESGASGWYLESGARISSTAPHGGTRALAVTSTGGYADQSVSLQPGKAYALSSWGYLTRPYDVGLVGIVYRDSSGKRMWDLEPPPIEFTLTRYRSATREFHVPAGVASAKVSIWKQEGGSGFFVDDLRIKLISNPEDEPPAGVQPACQRLMVPGYFDPRTTSLWQTTTETGSGVGLVIVNPNSGVDDRYDPVWSEVVQSSREAGFTVLAYVQTDFGARSSDSVIAEMDQYRAWYGVKDFFLDEAGTAYSAVDRYRAMVRNVHAGGGIAVLNFGWMPHPAYMEFTDIAGVFEDGFAAYGDDYERPAWFYDYPASRFLHIVHSTPADKWSTVIERSRLRNAGNVWVTDDNTVSYYKSLPTFWTKLNKTVRAGC